MNAKTGHRLMRNSKAMEGAVRKTRKIIEIDESLCDGCGACIISCAEGALAIVDGKARLVSEIHCDGLGACLGGCPKGALRIVERPAEEFDLKAADETKPGPEAAPPSGRGLQAHGGSGARKPHCCPSFAAEALPAAGKPAGRVLRAPESRLGHWPVKLALLSPGAPFLHGSCLVLLADCAAAAFPDLHDAILPGNVIAMGCPKLDDLDAHIEALTRILTEADVKSLTVVHMEVPCCFGFVHAAREAVSRSGKRLPLSRMKISKSGRILEREEIAA